MAGTAGTIFNTYFSSAVITNSTFMGNSARNSAGAMVNYDCSSASFINCTLSGNSAPDTGGIFNFWYSSVRVFNSFFWGDSGSEPEIHDAEDRSSSVVSYSIVTGGHVGTGNFSLDPLFNSDLTLQPGSPAIDAGGGDWNVLVTDGLGNPRWDAANVVNVPGGNGLDIGAYEYQGAAGTDTIVSNFTCE